MLVIRPIALADLAPLEALTALTGFGLTTLRAIPIFEAADSVFGSGFEKLTDDDRPRGETYLFVLEDHSTGRSPVHRHYCQGGGSIRFTHIASRRRFLNRGC